ncbi:MAG: hydantoinase/oxoprolinase family protein [Woeseiaceae bacterium]
MQSDIRLSADIGGTFTDIVLEVGEERFSVKVLTTYAAPEAAILSGMKLVCAKADVSPTDIAQVIHGTTLATNALIERNGAHTALITTRGFRDVIEMRTESRFEQYDLNLEIPEPLLPRQDRYVVTERMNAAGEELIPLDLDELDDVVGKIETGGYTSVAVGLIHGYANSSHEQTIRSVLAARLPNVMVSIASEVSPQMREYERFNTVVANAYIQPQMKTYLTRLTDQLSDAGVRCPVFLMHSGGGIISVESAAEFPVRLVESGPAGGAVFAAHIAARYGLDKVLSFDMGGTTAKICLIKDHTPKTSRVFEVARSYRFKKGSGMPISIPVIDMVEIGAGGGSLASLDAMRQVRVGPESAGSEPGPACYARGGLRPAVTDADLVLGKLDPDHFAGGEIPLDLSMSAQALDAVIGRPLEMDTQTAAFSVAEVVDENMANAARVHAVENGEDLAEFTMIAFGGAAPLHAARLCEKLGIRRLLVPPGAGVGSAIGFLRAPISFEATRTVHAVLSDFDGEQIAEVFDALESEASEFVNDCQPRTEIALTYKAYMRYVGQGWEVPVPLALEIRQAPTAEALKAAFESVYETLFGRIVQDADIEVSVWTATAATHTEPVEPMKPATANSVITASNARRLFDGAIGRFVDAKAYTRNALGTGDAFSGPAVITEHETTIVVPTSRRVICHADGCVELIDASQGAR